MFDQDNFLKNLWSFVVLQNLISVVISLKNLLPAYFDLLGGALPYFYIAVLLKYPAKYSLN
jgi:hypothetical protein